VKSVQKLRFQVVALMVFGVLLAACGAQGGAAPVTTVPAATSNAAPTTAAEATSAPASDTSATVAPAGAVDRTGWPATFRIGLFGGDDASATIQAVEPLRKLMEAQLGMPVEVTTGTSYSAVIEAMRAGRVDAMEVGPFSYVLAVQEANAEAIAVVMNAPDEENPVYDPDLAPAYYSVVITKKGSGIDSVDDLKDKSFAFVDPASTSGHLAPKTALIKQGINPDEEMQATFAGSHPTAVLSVWNDTTQAGATFEGNLYRLAREGQIQFCGFADEQVGKPRTPEEIKAVYDTCPDGNIVMLSYSDPIPNTPFAMNSALPQSFKDEVRRILLTTQDNPEFITQFKQWYTYPVADLGIDTLDEYYNSLRDIAQLLNLDLKELGG
jgi:phosphonate transport system substrate-binding protein